MIDPCIILCFKLKFNSTKNQQKLGRLKPAEKTNNVTIKED